MNSKKINSLVILVGLFCLVPLAFGQITPPLGVPTDYNVLLENILKAVFNVVATLGTAMIIVAGILYLTSAGSPERIGTAKKALIYAIVGMAIGLGGRMITDTVLSIIKSGS